MNIPPLTYEVAAVVIAWFVSGIDTRMRNTIVFGAIDFFLYNNQQTNKNIGNVTNYFVQ